MRRANLYLENDHIYGCWRQRSVGVYFDEYLFTLELNVVNKFEHSVIMLHRNR